MDTVQQEAASKLKKFIDKVVEEASSHGLSLVIGASDSFGQFSIMASGDFAAKTGLAQMVSLLCDREFLKKVRESE